MENLTINEFLLFLSPTGQQAIFEIIQDARKNHGAKWIDAIKTDYPSMTLIVDLVANFDAETAVSELQKEFPKYPLWICKAQLIKLHGRLKTEIDRKR